MAKRLSLLFAALALVFIFLASGCSLTPNRHVYLKYSFFVEPLGDENIKNLVLYLPFPVYKDKPVKEALKDLQEDYKHYHSDQEQALFSIASTKHGPMLKVEVPSMEKGIGAGFEIKISKKMPISEYYLWQESGNHLHPYLYNPRFKIKKKGKQRYAHTMIYSEGKGASGFSFGIRYDISDRAPSPFPYIFGHEWGGDFLAFFGIKELPDPIPGSAGVPIKIKGLGWKKIPVAECE